MPKIIENARNMLIDEAKKQIEENGYDAVTIRSIARGCAIGLGTFYNYFKSKDMLIATFLLDDWNNRISKIEILAEEASDPMCIVKSIHCELTGFIDSHAEIFKSNEAKKTFIHSVGAYHKLLVSQIAKPIHIVCLANGYENAEFLSQFVAEATLTWTVAKTDIAREQFSICRIR